MFPATADPLKHINQAQIIDAEMEITCTEANAPGGGVCKL